MPTGLAVLGNNVGKDAATHEEFCCQAHEFGLCGVDQIIQNAIGYGFVKRAFFTERPDIQLEAFQLDTFLVWDVIQNQRGKIRLTGFGAQTGKFRDFHMDMVIPLQIGIVESLDTLVWLGRHLVNSIRYWLPDFTIAYNNVMTHHSNAPFSGLTPDAILDAFDSVGLKSDWRLLALNSYENRVYQVGMEEGPPLVAKFYRPGRWLDAAIIEEHAFVDELAASEIPVVPTLPLNEGVTLHASGGFRFAIYPKQGGRAPELGSSDVLEWMGRFIGRIHAVGALTPFDARPKLDIESFGVEPRDYLLANGFIPADLDVAYRSVVDQALDGVRRCFERAGDVSMLRLHGDCRIVI